MRITAECSEKAATAAIGFFVKTGARDETTKLMGVSHFLETHDVQGYQDSKRRRC